MSRRVFDILASTGGAVVVVVLVVAIASFALAAILAVLVGAGLWHARRTASETELIRPQVKPVPAA
jgi:hypothetical protein